MSDEGKILYAIAYERQVSKTEIQANIEYTHATCVAGARYVFMSDPANQRRVRIVGIAPVVGYHVLDENTLSV